MAAVVASIAGILAGCGIHSQMGGFGSSSGGGGFVRDPSQERELGGLGTGGGGKGEHLTMTSAVWVQMRQAASYGIATMTLAGSLAMKSDTQGAVQAVMVPSKRAVEVQEHCVPALASVLEQDCVPALASVLEQEKEATEPEIASYAEVYGLCTEHEITPVQAEVVSTKKTVVFVEAEIASATAATTAVVEVQKTYRKSALASRTLEQDATCTQSRRSAKQGGGGDGGEGARHVHFLLTKRTVHEITPYSEVYGVHPRDFDFGKGLYAPRPCFVDPHAKSLPRMRMESDDEDGRISSLRMMQIRTRARHPLAPRPFPKHLWIALIVMCFLIRAFGVQALLDAVPEMPRWPLKQA